MSSLVRSYAFDLKDEQAMPTRSSSEFRRHKDVTNPVYIMGFLTQWKMYLDQLPAGPDAHTYRGEKLDPTIFEKVCGKNHFCWNQHRTLTLYSRCRQSSSRSCTR